MAVRWHSTVESRVPELIVGSLAVEEINKSSARAAVREAEESSLLEAIARERLVKTQQAGRDTAGGVVNCKMWRLAIEL
jgi:hypothetical protein